MTTTLICRETPGLKVGPGGPGTTRPDHAVVFTPVSAGPGRWPEYGIAVIEDDDPLREKKLSWIRSPGCPPIEVLDPDAEQTPSASDADAFLCPCGLPWISPAARDRHQAATYCRPAPYVPEGVI